MYYSRTYDSYSEAYGATVRLAAEGISTRLYLSGSGLVRHHSGSLDEWRYGESAADPAVPIRDASASHFTVLYRGYGTVYGATDPHDASFEIRIFPSRDWKMVG